MKSDEHLDVSGMAFPLGLVMCKATMERLADGKVLEIRLQDPATFNDLLKIVQRSGDQILDWEQQEEFYFLRVRRCIGCPVGREE